MSNLKERYLSVKNAIIEKDFGRMNDMQRRAVFTAQGPVLILAGAGSGKTTVLINRTACLLKYGCAYESDNLPFSLCESDVDFLENYLAGKESGEDADERAVDLISCDAPRPWQIMTITFTNKAAGELKERLNKMLGEGGDDIWAMTFHATCARMLRRDAPRIGYSSSFTIYDTDDQKRVIKSAMSELKIDDKALPIKMVINEISSAKDSLLSPDEYAMKAGADFRLKRVAQIYSLYQKKLAEADAMDFDDLLYNTVHLLATNEDILEYYQRRFRYIMVDEYQDTNHAQYKLIKLLADGHKNICVVGDDDQSIYKFRGATIENILNFEKNYQGAKVIRLEQNYRSTQNILDAANTVISNNTGRKGKMLWTANGRGEKVVCYNANDEKDEAAFIAQTVTDHLAAGGKYSDCAVLYRMRTQSGVIENHLLRAGIPYRVVAGRRFFDRKEIRDIIAYLSVIANHSDEVRLTRIINEPKRGIGDRSVQTASEIAAGLGISLFDVIASADQYPALSRSAKPLMAFAKMIQELTELVDDDEIGLDGLLEELLEKSGYKEALESLDENAQERLENIGELASTLVRYEQENPDDASLDGFLEDVALISDIDNYDTEADCVTLMTLHAAKGLEFPIVFIPGMEEGIFPGMQSMLDPNEIEEERRLAYVGITRAKQQLYILHSNTRVVFGQTTHGKLSRFAAEISPELLEFKGATRRVEMASVSRGGYGSDFQRQRTAQSITSAAPTAASQPSASYNVGDKVKHRVFGVGEVISAKRTGNDTLLEISFEKVGTKKLMANFAGLKKM